MTSNWNKTCFYNKSSQLLEKIIYNCIKNLETYEFSLKHFKDKINKDTNNIKYIIKEVERCLKANFDDYAQLFQKENYETSEEKKEEMIKFAEFVQKEVSILNSLKDSTYFLQMTGFSPEHNQSESESSVDDSLLKFKRSRCEENKAESTPEPIKVSHATSLIKEKSLKTQVVNVPSNDDDIADYDTLIKNFTKVIINEKLGPYILENIKSVVHHRVIYSSEFLFNDSGQTDFSMKFHADDEFLLQNKANFENVELTIIKKDKNACISSLLRAMENFFLIFIKRRDEQGNYKFKGVIKPKFVDFEGYFRNKFKSLRPIEMIQINVYLIKSDLFDDYSEIYDKTNLHRCDMNILMLNCKNLKNLRKYF